MRIKYLFLIVFLFQYNFLSGVLAQGIPILMDMVHHNPGEPLYESKYNNPEVLSELGFNSKCFYLFDSPTLAINWDTFDKDILPLGSPDREWVDRKASRLHYMFNRCKDEGLDVYAMSDLILLPKRLVAKYKLESNFGDPQDTLVQRILKYQVDEIFKEFPQMDGLIVRIGETYLEDAPYHVGNIQHKDDADRCIIPLINLLRDEICVKMNKKLIFRTWMSFDTDINKYEYISDKIEPHKNLFFAVKHCEGDFHRGNPFSKVLGLGHHPQIVEVQCAREYEGKGAFPNYVARGVIDGFEEHQTLKDKNKLWNLRELNKTGLLAGIWTWSRGGGWEGPYIKDELWCDLNTWIMIKWAENPKEKEKRLFDQYCKTVLHLNKLNTCLFRKIALYSEKAILLGLRSKDFPDDIMSMWVRDEYITFPDLPSDRQKVSVMLEEKNKAVDLWNEIADLSKKIKMQNPYQTEVVKTTCEYGRQMFRIYRAVFHLSAIKKNLSQEDKHIYILEYDDAWRRLEELSFSEPTTCPSLFLKNKVRRTFPEDADSEITKMR